MEAFLDRSRTINDWEQEAFQGYLVLGYSDANNERGIDHFHRGRGNALRDLESEVLGYMKEARASLFLIESVRRDVGLVLRDMLEDRNVFVHERLATHTADRGMLVLAWVTRVRDHYELVAGVTHVPPAHAELVMDTIEAECEKAAIAPADTPDAALFGCVLPAVHRVLRKAVDEYVAPKLLTGDGEELMGCRTVYEIVRSASGSNGTNHGRSCERTLKPTRRSLPSDASMPAR